MQCVTSSLSINQLAHLLVQQTDFAFPDGEPLQAEELLPSLSLALARLEHCFSAIDNNYFFDGKHAIFDHLHGDRLQHGCILPLISFIETELRKLGAKKSFC